MKIAVMAGSFDPVTNGHTWVMQRALDIADKLVIVVGHNPAKKTMFTPEERMMMVRDALEYQQGVRHDSFEVVTIGNQLLIDYAAAIGAEMLVRGIRNADDFRVENEINLIHSRIEPAIHTAYFIPPRELSEVSSSVVKGLVGFDRWERTVEQYVSPSVLIRLIHKAEKKV